MTGEPCVWVGTHTQTARTQTAAAFAPLRKTISAGPLRAATYSLLPGVQALPFLDYGLIQWLFINRK
jgi:hypothetical protein